MSRGRHWLALALTLALGGCSKENVVSVTGNTGGGGGTPGDQLPDCASEAGSPPGSGGSPMLPVGRTDGTCFWMDQLETSRADYEAFLASSPDVAQHQATVPECSWNESFEPDAACEGHASAPTEADRPMVCVDWCDALAYCKSVGKTLCRGLAAEPASARTSSWYSVCSHGGQREYPYGNEQDPLLCNGGTFADPPAAAPVTQQTGCATPEGVLNLSGNAAEWVDECKNTSGGNDDCTYRGGSFLDDTDSLRCALTKSAKREAAFFFVGLRCCAYAP